MKFIILFSSTVLILLSGLFVYLVVNFRPNFTCGDSKYYTFQDVEGVEIITNSSNSEFKYDLFPSIFYRNVEKKFPYRVYLKYNNSKYVNYIGNDSNLEKQISNLKNCYPDATFEIKTIS